MDKIIIAGGGFSGLMEGALLSKDYEVLILEKNKTLGGLFQTFIREDDILYPGAHFIGGVSKDGVWRKCFETLGLEMDDYFHKIETITIHWKGKQYQLPIELNQLKIKLMAMFPEEKRLEEFFEDLRIYEEVFRENNEKGLQKMFMENINLTFEGLLLRYFSNKFLIILLLSYVPAYAGIGANGNAFTALSVLISYGMGAAYIKGGNERLIQKLKQIILGNGGEIRYDTEVLSIIEEEEYYSVEYKQKNNLVQKSRCNKVVLACFPLDILEKSFSEYETVKKMKKLNKGPSVIRVISKISERNKEHIIDSEIMDYGYCEYNEIDEQIFFNERSQVTPFCTISFPTAKDDEEKEYTYIMFTFLTYEITKKDDVKNILALVSQKHLGFSEHIEIGSVFLSDYYKERAGNHWGSVFGWERNRMTNLSTNRFSPVFKEKQNIYIIGNWSTDFGIYGCARTALLAYEKINVDKKLN